MIKYSFTGETKEHFGVILHRIKAERDFGNVCEGDLGGWIEKEDNLSHNGSAWVYGEARVYGDARVYGEARVYGGARVYGDAEVYGEARVYGGAWDSSPLFIQGLRWGFGMASKEEVRIGCQAHTFDWWRKHYKTIIRRFNPSNDEIKKYAMCFNMAVAWYDGGEMVDIDRLCEGI